MSYFKSPFQNKEHEPGRWELVRSNAVRWGVAVEGPLPCRERCPYRRYFEEYCPDPKNTVPGTLCVVERAYATAYAMDMRTQHELLQRERPDDLAEIIDEAVKVALLRERIGARGNRAWDLGAEKWAEMNLCSRYWTAMNNRQMKVIQKLDQLYEDVRLELEDRRWRRLALTCIGDRSVPEPYRSWGVDTMACLRAQQSTTSA